MGCGVFDVDFGPLFPPLALFCLVFNVFDDLSDSFGIEVFGVVVFSSLVDLVVSSFVTGGAFLFGGDLDFGTAFFFAVGVASLVLSPAEGDRELLVGFRVIFDEDGCRSWIFGVEGTERILEERLRFDLFEGVSSCSVLDTIGIFEIEFPGVNLDFFVQERPRFVPGLRLECLLPGLLPALLIVRDNDLPRDSLPGF